MTPARKKTHGGIRNTASRRAMPGGPRRGPADAFFVSAPAGLALVDAGLRYLRVNETLARMNGRPAEAHLGRTVRAVAPHVGAVVEPILRTVLTTNAPILNVPLTLPAGAGHGAAQHRIASYFPVRRARGTAAGIGIIVVDVTERERAADDLRRALERDQRLAEELRLLLESTHDGIFGVDAEGRCTFINQSGAAMLGFAPPDLLGQDIHALVHHTRADGSPYPADECPVYLTVRTGERYRLEEEVFWRRDGTAVLVAYTSYPLLWDGAVRGGVVTFNDITARKRAEEALRIRVLQEESIARFGLLALGDAAADELMGQGAVLVAQGLGVEYSKILELLPGDEALRLRAGVGWRPGLVGHATEPAGSGSLAGYTLRSGSPVVCTDLRADTRFSNSPLLESHGVVSGIDVIVYGKDRPFGILGAHTTRPRTFSDDDIHFLQAMANVIGAAVEYRQATGDLRALSRRLLEANEDAQRAVARELHDEIGQALTALKAVLEMAAQRPAGRPEDLREARGLVADVLKRVRSLTLDLRPSALDDLGLVPTLRHHLERYKATTGIEVAMKHAGVEDRRFGTDAETAAYRIVQEALTNVARHAGVRAASVRLWATDVTLGVQIEDTGAGFEHSAVLAQQQSSGLLGMRERAALLGGRCSIESAPGRGTRVTAEIPYRDAAGRSSPGAGHDDDRAGR